MNRKRNTVKKKDPKKVAAGKARARKAIRIDGKFTSNAFNTEVKRLADSVGHKDFYKFFLEHEIELTDMYKEGGVRSPVPRQMGTIFREAEKASGKLYIERDGESYEVTIHELKNEVQQFEQWVYTNYNCTGIEWTPFVTMARDYIIKLPNYDIIEGMDAESLVDYCLPLGIRIYISDPTRKKGTKRNRRIKATREKKLQKVTKLIADAKAKTKKRKGSPRTAKPPVRPVHSKTKKGTKHKKR